MPMIRIPSGNPCLSKPTDTEKAGITTQLAITVNQSEMHIAMGSSFSPIRNPGSGVVGIKKLAIKA